MFSKQSIHWKKSTIICYTLIILMMALLAFFNNKGFQSLIENDFWAKHSLKVIHTSKEILLALENAETSQRGYIITGDSVYLKSYSSSLDSAFSYQQQLNILTLDNPTQQALIKELNQLIKEKINLLNLTLVWKNEGEEAKLARYFAVRRGKRRMENVRSQLEKIVQAEEKLLAQRNEELKSSFQWMKRAQHAIIVITIFISLLLYFLFRQQLRLKQSFEKELLHKNNILSSTNQQLENSTKQIETRNEQLLALNEELKRSQSQLTELNTRLEDRVQKRTKQLNNLNNENLQLLEQEKLSRMHLEFITNSIPEIVWQTQPNGDHDFFNKRWYEFTGRSPAESMNQAWTSVLHPDDYQNNLNNWKSALETGLPYEAECRLRSANGSHRWFISRALPFKDKEGNIIKWIGTCTDIHDFKIQEQSLENRNQRLNEMYQYLDNFIHATAHNLRAPITNIQGLVMILNKPTNLEESKRQILVELLSQSVNRVDDTLRSLIRLIELQSDEIPQKERVDLEVLWASVMKENQNLSDTTTHKIQSDFSSCKEIYAVKPYLESIFQNLLTNALKYKKEEEELVLRVNSQQKDGLVLIKFQDNGIGIDLEKHGKKIFKPFARFTSQAQGSGIGLHMACKMLQRMDGDIKVESTEGTGSTFTVSLKEAEQACSLTSSTTPASNQILSGGF